MHKSSPDIVLIKPLHAPYISNPIILPYLPLHIIKNKLYVPSSLAEHMVNI